MRCHCDFHYLRWGGVWLEQSALAGALEWCNAFDKWQNPYCGGVCQPTICLPHIKANMRECLPVTAQVVCVCVLGRKLSMNNKIVRIKTLLMSAFRASFHRIHPLHFALFTLTLGHTIYIVKISVVAVVYVMCDLPNTVCHRRWFCVCVFCLLAFSACRRRVRREDRQHSAGWRGVGDDIHRSSQHGNERK